MDVVGVELRRTSAGRGSMASRLVSGLITRDGTEDLYAGSLKPPAFVVYGKFLARQLILQPYKAGVDISRRCPSGFP